MYGTLLRCATYVFFEGKPNLPNGKIWELIEHYKVKALGCPPTWLKIFKRVDPEGEYIKKRDLSSLQSAHFYGERTSPDTILWVHRHLPHVLLADNWGQTELGCSGLTNSVNINEGGPILPTLPGSVTRPMNGFDIRVFNE
jgi:propionyl-CoA synthetase